MQKTLEIRSWILVSFINTSEIFGVNPNTLYVNKPGEFKIELGQFFRIFDKMEEEGLLKKAEVNYGNYCLTQIGKKEAIKIKRKLKFGEYYSIISKFPDIEIRERIEILESFIITSVALYFLSILNKIPILVYIKDINLFIVLSSLLLFVSLQVIYHFSKNFVKIVLFWIISLQRDTLWVYKEMLWNNRSIIIRILIYSSMVLIILFVYIMNIVQWQIMVWGLALFSLNKISSNHKWIFEKFQSIFEKYLK